MAGFQSFMPVVPIHKTTQPLLCPSTGPRLQFITFRACSETRHVSESSEQVPRRRGHPSKRSLAGSEPLAAEARVPQPPSGKTGRTPVPRRSSRRPVASEEGMSSPSHTKRKNGGARPETAVGMSDGQPMPRRKGRSRKPPSSRENHPRDNSEGHSKPNPSLRSNDDTSSAQLKRESSDLPPTTSPARAARRSASKRKGSRNAEPIPKNEEDAQRPGSGDLRTLPVSENSESEDLPIELGTSKPRNDSSERNRHRLLRRGSKLRPNASPKEEAAARLEQVEKIIAESEDDPNAPDVIFGAGGDPMVHAVEDNLMIKVRRPEEELILRETPFRDGRYGACFNCGGHVVIPGLAQFYCEHCGWIRRPVETQVISPGHHD